MAEAADKNALTDEQVRRVINMLLRPKAGQPGARKPFDPSTAPVNTRELAKSFNGGMQSLDQLVGRMGIGDLVTKGVSGAADLTNQYAKDAFKSDREFQDTFAFGGDPNAEGTLWPAGSGALLGSGTRIAAKTLPEAFKALGPVGKGALAGAKAGTYGAWVKDHLGHEKQASVDDAVLLVGKTISEQSGYVQERLKKLMGDKAFNWAKQQNKPAFSPQSMNDPKFAPTMKALGEAGIKLPGQQPQDGGRGPGMIGSMLGIFAGPYGAANLAKSGYPQPQQALDMAKKLSDTGASAKEIFDITSHFLKDTPFAGVAKTKDGQFRFEIPDNEMKIKKTGHSDRIDDAISHPLYFAAYPKMKERAIDIGDSAKATLPVGAVGAYQTGSGHIGAVEHQNMTMLGTLAHELNHGAQAFEGDLFEGNMMNTDPKKYNYNTYIKQPSEAEADESYTRQDWTPELRRQHAPYYSSEEGKSRLFSPGPKQPWQPWMGERPKSPSKPTQVSEVPDSFAGLMKQLLAAYRKEMAKETGKTAASP